MTALALPLRFGRLETAAVAEEYWRSLSYFNLSRLVVAGALLFAIVAYGDARAFGASDPALFYKVCLAYLLLAAVFWWGLKRIRTVFSVHLALQAVTDIAVITLLVHASGGIRSGLGILYLMPLAAAASVTGGRMSLFYASLATFGLFAENTYWVLRYDIGISDYFQTGLLAAGCFVVAIVTNRLAKRLIANEALVRQRSADLRGQMEINRLVIRDMPSGVLVVDAAGLVNLANPEAERLLGRDRAAGLPLASLAPALDAIGRRWRSQHGAGRLQADVGGHQVYVRLVDAARGAGGEMVMFLEDAAKLREQAQQVKLAALGRLTANIAHEIRNPLSAIGHAAELLGEEGRNSPQLGRLTRIIGENTARLDRIVQEVLQLNRRDRASVEEVPLQAFLRSVVEQISQAERVPLEAFRINMPPACVAVFDRQHLNRILWNLINNAWRHSRRQAGSIWIDLTARHERRIELHVLDDGDGIDPDLVPQLFEPFFTTSSRGTGLGLYIARELAEANLASLDYVSAAERDPGLRERAGAGGADFRLIMEGYG